MYWAYLGHYSPRTLAFACAVVVLLLAYPVMRVMGNDAPAYLPSLTSQQPVTEPVTPAIVLTQESLANSNTSSATASTIVSAKEVQTQADLASYAQSRMQTDPHISRIELAEDRVSMTYDSTFLVLGVKELSGETQASISSNGILTITHPWYESVFGKVVSASTPNEGFSDIVFAPYAEVGMDPHTQARMIQRMHGRFQTGAL